MSIGIFNEFSTDCSLLKHSLMFSGQRLFRSYSCDRWLQPCIVVWGVTVFLGMQMLTSYSLDAIQAPTIPTQWPCDTNIERLIGQHQLLVFLHPKCSCSKATVTELHKALQNSKRSIAVTAVFFAPTGALANWTHGDLWDSCSQNFDGQCFTDSAGRESTRFGVQTSGHVMLFDEDGAQQFSGGVTSSRGHVGDNLGSNLIVQLLNGDTINTVEPPVFGCQIALPGSSGSGNEVGVL